jgi:hypothetical protein
MPSDRTEVCADNVRCWHHLRSGLPLCPSLVSVVIVAHCHILSHKSSSTILAISTPLFLRTPSAIEMSCMTEHKICLNILLDKSEA